MDVDRIYAASDRRIIRTLDIARGKRRSPGRRNIADDTRQLVEILVGDDALTHVIQRHES